jgi:hypothetical protein
MKTNNNKPPKEIDGAKVLFWAWSGKEPFGTIKYVGGNMDGKIAAEIYGLAICQYEKSSKIYRFSCNRKWETEQDSDYDSIEEAKEQLPFQYQKVDADWIVYE